MCFAYALDILESPNVCTIPTLNRSSAIQFFEGSNTFEVCNKIIFNFYTNTALVLSI